jgi:hypothetical protein
MAMDIASYLYPWDVLGDPGAGELIAGLGLDHVVVAAGYHATRALTPRHPRHRVVVAEHSAAYYPTADDAWRGSPLRPAPAGWLPETDSFGDTVEALASVGVPVHAWVVLLHTDATAPADPVDPQYSVVNAYGDRYPWALCPSRPAVRHYARTLAAEVAARPGIRGLELESCGWYGFDHLSGHDKTAGVALGQAEQYLFSLCFCPDCEREYLEDGVDAAELADVVRTALDRAVFQAAGPNLATNEGGETARIAGLLGADLAAAVGRMRQRVADGLRAEVVAAVRAAGPGLPVALHAHPNPHRTASFTGVVPARAAEIVDRLVVNCWQGPEVVAPTRAAGAGSVLAGLLAVQGMGGRPDLVEQAERARAAGADGLRLYHAGLASAADLAAIAALTNAGKGW